MPDIQTEMQKILQTWDKETLETTATTLEKMVENLETTKGPKLFTPTNNVTKTTFESVRDNPGLSKKEYIRRLEASGYKKASTSSLLSQMVRQGMLWVGSDGALHPNAKEYAPLKPAKTFAKQQGIKPAPKKTKSYKVITPAKKYKTKEVPVPAGITSLVSDLKAVDRVQEIMNTISLPEAKRLYNSLATYFEVR